MFSMIDDVCWIKKISAMFVCLVLRPNGDFFHSYGDVTITGEGLKF